MGSGVPLTELGTGESEARTLGALLARFVAGTRAGETSKSDSAAATNPAGYGGMGGKMRSGVEQGVAVVVTVGLRKPELHMPWPPKAVQETCSPWCVGRPVREQRLVHASDVLDNVSLVEFSVHVGRPVELLSGEEDVHLNATDVAETQRVCCNSERELAVDRDRAENGKEYHTQRDRHLASGRGESVHACWLTIFVVYNEC